MAELHRVHSGEAEVPSLLLMAEALKALNRPAQAIRALEAASQRAPDNRAIVQRLDETRRATGILVRRVATEPEAEPRAPACAARGSANRSIPGKRSASASGPAASSGGAAPISRRGRRTGVRTPALPMPDALAGSGPGIYALTARAGDGTPNAPTGVQMIVRTDFAPTIWRGTDGLTVQVRSYSDVHPRAGVTLRLLAPNHDRCRWRRPLRRAADAWR